MDHHDGLLPGRHLKRVNVVRSRNSSRGGATSRPALAVEMRRRSTGVCGHGRRGANLMCGHAGRGTAGSSGASGLLLAAGAAGRIG